MKSTECVCDSIQTPPRNDSLTSCAAGTPTPPPPAVPFSAAHREVVFSNAKSVAHECSIPPSTDAVPASGVNVCPVAFDARPPFELPLATAMDEPSAGSAPPNDAYSRPLNIASARRSTAPVVPATLTVAPPPRAKKRTPASSSPDKDAPASQNPEPSTVTAAVAALGAPLLSVSLYASTVRVPVSMVPFERSSATVLAADGLYGDPATAS